MNDAVGSPQRALVLGGTSELALAVMDRLVDRRCRQVVLACRRPDAPEATAAADRLRSRGADVVELVPFDACDPATHAPAITAATDALGDLDLVVWAAGVLGDQATFDADPAAAWDAVTANYTGAVSACLNVAGVLRRQGHGTLMVLSSVAGQRARAENYVYGSAKAGLDAFAQGLGDALAPHGVHVMVVRPGFVHTRMTAGMDPAPFATTADEVADRVVRGLERQDRVVWAPPVLRGVFAVMRSLPVGVWRRVSTR
jgi:decaprenylphospho-beta-D-erythro-pentofuranosid-2-ulose 2-reductase